MVEQNGFAITKADGFDAVTIEIQCQGIPRDRSIGGLIGCAVPEGIEQLAEASTTHQTAEDTRRKGQCPGKQSTTRPKKH